MSLKDSSHSTFAKRIMLILARLNTQWWQLRKLSLASKFEGILLSMNVSKRNSGKLIGEVQLTRNLFNQYIRSSKNLEIVFKQHLTSKKSFLASLDQSAINPLCEGKGPRTQWRPNRITPKSQVLRFFFCTNSLCFPCVLVGEASGGS